MFKKLAMAGAVAATLFAGTAQATTETISFEDITGLATCGTKDCNNSAVLPGNTYAGFTWATSSSLRIYSEDRAIGDTFYDSTTAATMTVSTGLGTYMTATGATSVATETSGYFVAVLENNSSSLTFTNATFADAGGFTLDSLFLYNDKSSKTTVTITGVTTSGTTVTVTEIIAGGSGGTYSLAGTALESVALTSVTIYTTQGKLAIDNITVTTVPEPSSYAMLLAGLGMMGFMVRRRSK